MALIGMNEHALHHPARADFEAASSDGEALAMTSAPATAPSSPALVRGHLSWLSFMRMTLEPFVAVISYIIVMRSYHERFEGKDLVLCLIVFSLMFPGDVSLTRARAGLAKSILANWILVVAVLYFFGWATTYSAYFYMDALRSWAIAAPIAIYVAHRLIPVIAPRLLAMEGVRTAVVVGANEAGKRLAEQFQTKPLLGVKFAGFFDDRATSRVGINGEAELRGRLVDLPRYVKESNVSAIFISLPMASQPRIVQLLESLYDTTASIYFVPHIFVYDAIQARIDDVDGLPVVAVCESPFYGVAGFVKRLEDLVLGTVFLLATAPLLIAIAIGIKLSSRGPVLFKQRRYGLDGKEITVYKFRSMRVMEDGAVIRQAKKGDPRTTRFGALLRKTSLDELPQLINVLQGCMSLVGPRPHAVAHNEMYRALIRGYMVRHKVKPGITGLAQVNGFRGETETVDKMKARVAYDLDYLRHWSLQLDLSIIIKTIVVVLTGRNAY